MPERVSCDFVLFGAKRSHFFEYAKLVDLITEVFILDEIECEEVDSLLSERS